MNRLAWWALAVVVVVPGCGRDERNARGPATLDEALARQYRGRTLRDLLLKARPADQRSLLGVIIGFRTVFGSEGARWLATAVASGIPSDRQAALYLLDGDLEAAQQATGVLAGWLESEEDAKSRLWVARLLVEADGPSDRARALILDALRSEDGLLGEAAVMQLYTIGSGVDKFADDLLALVETYPPPKRDSAIDPIYYGPAHDKGPADRCDMFLMLLARAGPRADPLVPRLVALLRRPEYRKRAVLDAIGARGPAAAAVVPDLARAVSSDPDTREAVARALGRIGVGADGSDAAIAALRDLAGDPEESVRAAAQQALAAIGASRHARD